MTDGQQLSAVRLFSRQSPLILFSSSYRNTEAVVARIDQSAVPSLASAACPSSTAKAICERRACPRTSPSDSAHPAPLRRKHSSLSRATIPARVSCPTVRRSRAEGRASVRLVISKGPDPSAAQGSQHVRCRWPAASERTPADTPLPRGQAARRWLSHCIAPKCTRGSMAIVGFRLCRRAGSLPRTIRASAWRASRKARADHRRERFRP